MKAYGHRNLTLRKDEKNIIHSHYNHHFYF